MTDYRLMGDGAVTHSEVAAFPGLQRVELRAVAAAVNEAYRNLVVFDINTHCVRLAVMEGEFRWHHHPGSDECFVVLEGELEIDLAGGATHSLRPGDAFTIPKGVVHRTRARTRAVNLCFEDRSAYTDVEFDEVPESGTRLNVPVTSDP